jgi:hypothetical protein
VRPLLSSSPTLHLRVARDTVRAEARRQGVSLWVGETSYESPEGLAEAIARLAAEPSVHCRRLTATLERPPVQLRTLTDLPSVKPRELTALVAHQASRFFRQNGKPLVTDAVWIGHGSFRVAKAAAVEEPLVEAILNGARAAGIVIESIGPAECDAPLLLLPGWERAARARRRRRTLRFAMLATAGLWVAVVSGFLARVVLERRAVERELTALQAPLHAVLDARHVMHAAEATVRAVGEAQRGRGQASALLGAIAAALPDSAVLTSLTLNTDGSGVVSGLTKVAADVLARLERSGAIASPRFEGPIVKEAIAGREWERFTIVIGNRGPGPGGRR